MSYFIKPKPKKGVPGTGLNKGFSVSSRNRTPVSRSSLLKEATPSIVELKTVPLIKSYVPGRAQGTKKTSSNTYTAMYKRGGKRKRKTQKKRKGKKSKKAR